MIELYQLVVYLGRSELCVYDVINLDDSPEQCYSVAIGTYLTPTPLGEFDLTKIVHKPYNDFLGDWVLITDRYTTTGLPVAIHGTNRPDLIGLPVSQGCIRVNNYDLQSMIDNYGHSLIGGRVDE